MAIFNPAQLLEQSDSLTIPPSAGPPRQANLRRAVSTAYYALFHFMLSAATDEIVGVTNRRTPRYALVYRSLDHRSLKTLCEQAVKVNPPPKFAKFFPRNGLGNHIQTFASAALELQEKRHLADYDPSYKVNTSEAKLVIATARSAIRRFSRTRVQQRKAFLALLMFPPR